MAVLDLFPRRFNKHQKVVIKLSLNTDINPTSRNTKLNNFLFEAELELAGTYIVTRYMYPTPNRDSGPDLLHSWFIPAAWLSNNTESPRIQIIKL